MTQEPEVFVHATYPRQADAAHAVTALVDARFSPDKVGALMCNPEGVEELEIMHSTTVGPSTFIGLGVGAVAGAIATASGLMVAGPAFFGLDGALIGGLIGMLLGTLARFGFWKDEIKFPAHAFAKGSVLIGICTPESRVEAARCALLNAGAYEVHVSTKNTALAA